MESMRALAILFVLAAVPCAAQQAPADSTRVYELSEVEVLPRPQNVADFTAALQQAYPPHLYQAGVGGTVQLSFIVGPDGAPAEVRVVDSPDTAFNAPSVQAVSLLRFSPAQVQGQPVPVRVVQPIGWVAPPAQTAAAARPAAGAPASGDSVNGYELSGVDELPRVLNGRDFGRELARLYPAPLRDAGMQGTVQVRFLIERDGTTSNAVVTHSTDREFNRPTLEAVRTLRFRPARVNGRPVRVWVEQPIMWTVSASARGPLPPAQPRATTIPVFPTPRECGTYTQC